MSKAMYILAFVCAFIAAMLLATVSIVSNSPLTRAVSVASLIISWSMFMLALIAITKKEKNDEDK